MRTLRTACFLIAVGIAMARSGSLIHNAPAEAATKRNPYEGDARAQRTGAKLYARECASCHGAEREGRKNAPPLNRPDVRETSSGTLFWVLRNGSLDGGMPSFAHLPEARRWQIIAYLQQR